MAPVICLIKVRPEPPPVLCSCLGAECTCQPAFPPKKTPINGAVVIKISGFSPGSTSESVNRLLQRRRCTHFLPPGLFVSAVLLQVSEGAAVCSRGLTK